MDCPYFKHCGGCRYPLNDYEASLRKKVSIISKELEPFKVERVVPNIDIYHYRHKIIYRFFEKNRRVCAGFYDEGSNKLSSITNCLIQKEVACDIMEDILKLANQYRLRVYDPKSRRGLLRYVLMRVSKDDKVLVCFVVGSNVFPGAKDFFKELRKKHPEIVDLELLVHPRDTSVVMEGRPKTIYGKGYVKDYLKDFCFHIAADSFYQVNPKMAEVIYEDVIDRLKLKKDDVVLDAYSGIGTISLFLSKKAKKVYGVEVNPKAHQSAILSARENKVDNVSFICSDVKDYAMEHPFDVLVVDPPRSGMDDAFIAMILSKKPRKIAYVSCEPISMARDLKKLSKAYSIEPITLYDQFGFTKHLEALTILHLK